MSHPDVHESGEVRETACPEDIPSTEPPTEEDKGEANGEESEPTGTQTTGAFGQTY